MKIPDWLTVYGDVTWRGKCPPEHIEQASFFSKLRREYPDSYGLIAFHPRNEQQLRNGQFSSVLQHKAEGLVAGASDIIIPASPAFVCEMKRVDASQSKWQAGQVEYLEAARGAGSFSCVAFGAVAAWAAFQDWLIIRTATISNS